MKIAHFIHDHPRHPTIGGGGAVRVHEIARRLTARGHEVRIFSGWFEGCESPAIQPRDYAVHFLGRPRRPAAKAVEFAAAAWRNFDRAVADADVVIEDFSPYAPVGAFRAQRRGVAVALQIQNYMGRQFLGRHGPAGVPLMWVERFYPRLYRHHLLVGENLRSRFRARETAQVVPMGFEAGAASFSETRDRDYAAFLGRIDFNQKGLDLLLQALEGTGIPVRFAGSGAEAARLEQAVGRLPGCRVLGPLHGAEKWDFLQGARFLIMPSRFEGQPIVAIEAAAAGTPLLASAIPELDFITQNQIGRQFAPFTADALRRALRETWNDADGLRLWSGRGREFARTRTWEEIALQFEAALIALRSPTQP